MAEIPAPVRAQIVNKEISLLQEYESHQGIPLDTHPFWGVHTLLARDIQARMQLQQGIRESLQLIRDGHKDSVAGFCFLEIIIEE